MTATTTMTASQQLLHRFKDASGIATNYGVAKRLGVNTNAVDQWQRGGGMDDTTALQIAEALELDPLATIAAVRVDRAKTVRERDIWRKYCARVCVAAIVAFSAGHSSDSETQSLDTLYIMRRWLRWAFKMGLIPMTATLSRTAKRQRLRAFA